MANYQILTNDQHRPVRVLPQNSMGFAAQSPMAQIFAVELPLAVKAFPVVFTQQPAGFSLIGLFGLAPDENRFVTPDGRWNGSYVPAIFRRGPFIAAYDEQGNSLVALDVEHELVNTEHGEALFDLMGEPTTFLRNVTGFLTELERSRRQTEHAVAALAAAELLVPWNLEVADAGEEKRVVSGLFRVDEDKLNALPDEQFLQLRQAGALPVVYSHLLSLGNVRHLLELGKPNANAATNDFSGVEQDGLLHFGGLR